MRNKKKETTLSNLAFFSFFFCKNHLFTYIYINKLFLQAKTFFFIYFFAGAFLAAGLAATGLLAAIFLVKPMAFLRAALF